MKQFKVIKEFGCANKGELFNEEDENFVLDVDSNCNDMYCSRYMSISPSVMDTLVDAGFVTEIVQPSLREEELLNKINKISDTIHKLKEQYAEDHKSLTEEYNEGNVPACIKTEADTVYFNMNKILDTIDNLLNE